MKSYRKKERNSRESSSRWNDDFNEKKKKKTADFPFYVHLFTKIVLENVMSVGEASYVRRLGFSIFQLLELGCTYAKLAFAECTAVES